MYDVGILQIHFVRLRELANLFPIRISNFLLLALSIPVNLFFDLLRKKFFIFFVIFDFLFLFE